MNVKSLIRILSTFSFSFFKSRIKSDQEKICTNKQIQYKIH